jgi:hypothetical protein
MPGTKIYRDSDRGLRYLCPCPKCEERQVPRRLEAALRLTGSAAISQPPGAADFAAWRQETAAKIEKLPINADGIGGGRSRQPSSYSPYVKALTPRRVGEALPGSGRERTNSPPQPSRFMSFRPRGYPAYVLLRHNCPGCHPAQSGSHWRRSLRPRRAYTPRLPHPWLVLSTLRSSALLLDQAVQAQDRSEAAFRAFGEHVASHQCGAPGLRLSPGREPAGPLRSKQRSAS